MAALAWGWLYSRLRMSSTARLGVKRWVVMDGIALCSRWLALVTMNGCSLIQRLSGSDIALVVTALDEALADADDLFLAETMIHSLPSVLNVWFLWQTCSSMEVVNHNYHKLKISWL
jgi:hypothetical protein